MYRLLVLTEITLWTLKLPWVHIHGMGSFMNSSLMPNEITLIYTEIKIQYSKNIDLLIWMRWWKSYITMKKVLLRFLLPSSGKLSFWITEFLLTGSSGHHNGWAGGQEVGLLHQIPKLFIKNNPKTFSFFPKKIQILKIWKPIKLFISRKNGRKGDFQISTGFQFWWLNLSWLRLEVFYSHFNIQCCLKIHETIVYENALAY